MPQELPGFYFDPEKNRYFPIKGPIPGSSRKPPAPPQKPSPQPTKAESAHRRDNRTSKLLQYRELYGKIIKFSNRNGSFQEEYSKKLVCQPKVWKYQGLDRDGDGAVTMVHIDVETPVGQCRSDALLTGSMNCSLSLFDVGNIGQKFNHGVKTTSDRVWPESNKANCSEMPNDIWRLNGATLIMPSSISCISIPRKEHIQADNDGAVAQHALITTLGSEISGGALYMLNLADPVDLTSSIPAVQRSRELASLNCTIWTADSICNASRAVVGTDLGATLVDLETGVQSMLCRSKSDVLSVQLIQSGNAVLCGLRNGAVVTVDARQRQRQLPRHRIPYASREVSEPSSRNLQKTTKPCSMDGSIKLYDHRLTKRGPIQSYEGHVNSHTRIQLATDTSERFLMSGGEDCNVRIWSIKSGEMLFQEKFSSSIPSTVCWRGNKGSSASMNELQSVEECSGWDAWLGSAEGLFRMQFP